jgi:hypothetical protein
LVKKWGQKNVGRPIDPRETARKQFWVRSAGGRAPRVVSFTPLTKFGGLGCGGFKVQMPACRLRPISFLSEKGGPVTPPSFFLVMNS